MSKPSNISIANARIAFPNFSAKPEKYNQHPMRNFLLILEDEGLVENLIADGWNVKRFRPREGEERGTAYLQVKVNFNNKPPIIWLITGDRKTRVHEDMIEAFDYMEFENIDLIIEPYQYDVNGKTGISAYLKTMYATKVVDEFESKYADVGDDDCPF